MIQQQIYRNEVNSYRVLAAGKSLRDNPLSRELAEQAYLPAGVRAFARVCLPQGAALLVRNSARLSHQLYMTQWENDSILSGGILLPEMFRDEYAGSVEGAILPDINAVGFTVGIQNGIGLFCSAAQKLFQKNKRLLGDFLNALVGLLNPGCGYRGIYVRTDSPMQTEAYWLMEMLLRVYPRVLSRHVGYRTFAPEYGCPDMPVFFDTVDIDDLAGYYAVFDISSGTMKLPRGSSVHDWEHNRRFADYIMDNTLRSVLSLRGLLSGIEVFAPGMPDPGFLKAPKPVQPPETKAIPSRKKQRVEKAVAVPASVFEKPAEAVTENNAVRETVLKETVIEKVIIPEAAAPETVPAEIVRPEPEQEPPLPDESTFIESEFVQPEESKAPEKCEIPEETVTPEEAGTIEPADTPKEIPESVFFEPVQTESAEKSDEDVIEPAPSESAKEKRWSVPQFFRRLKTEETSSDAPESETSPAEPAEEADPYDEPVPEKKAKRRLSFWKKTEKDEEPAEENLFGDSSVPKPPKARSEKPTSEEKYLRSHIYEYSRLSARQLSDRWRTALADLIRMPLNSEKRIRRSISNLRAIDKLLRDPDMLRKPALIRTLMQSALCIMDICFDDMILGIDDKSIQDTIVYILSTIDCEAFGEQYCYGWYARRNILYCTVLQTQQDDDLALFEYLRDTLMNDIQSCTSNSLLNIQNELLYCMTMTAELFERNASMESAENRRLLDRLALLGVFAECLNTTKGLRWYADRTGTGLYGPHNTELSDALQHAGLYRAYCERLTELIDSL